MIAFQKFHWTWLCEHDDENFIFVLRCINGVITITLWISWISLPSTILYQTIEITLVQVSTSHIFAFTIKLSYFNYLGLRRENTNLPIWFQIYAGICLAFFVIIHLAIEVRNYVHKRHIQSIYKNVTQENVDVVSTLRGTIKFQMYVYEYLAYLAWSITQMMICNLCSREKVEYLLIDLLDWQVLW